MAKLNLTLEAMRQVVRRSRARFNSLPVAFADRAHDKHIVENETYFNAEYGNRSDELSILENEGYIRRVPGHIYIVLA